jgi:hypothetical protein
MSQALVTAQACGCNPATTLMGCVTVFQSGNRKFGVMLSADYDGGPVAIIHEFDPFQP